MRKKPDHLKVVAGTFRRDRSNPSAPAPTPGLPIAPAWLNPRSAEIFGELAAILDAAGTASPDHAHMLALLASRLAEIELCTGVIEDLGRTYTTTTKTGALMFRTRPEVAIRNDALRHAQSLLGEFGLSPAQVGRVGRSTARGTNPFAGI